MHVYNWDLEHCGDFQLIVGSSTWKVPVYLLRAVFLNCLFFLGLFCFPSTLFWFLAPLSFLFSAIRHRILWAKGWEHVSIRWLLEPQTEHCGFRRPLPRLVMFDLKHKHLLLEHLHVWKSLVGCKHMTFWLCSLFTTHENNKLTVRIEKHRQKRQGHKNDTKSPKRHKNWKSTGGVAPTKNEMSSLWWRLHPGWGGGWTQVIMSNS